MSSPPSDPIRLKIAYKRPEATLNELTRSVSRGRVSLRSPKKVEVGTRFVFELRTQGIAKPIEVFGEVERVMPLGPEFLVSIRYDAPKSREGIDDAIAALDRSHELEKVRQFVRIPLNLPAQSDDPYSPSFVIRDLSRGGMGVQVEAPDLPKTIVPGGLVVTEIWFGVNRIALYGEVAWAAAAPHARGFTPPSFGIRFGKLREQTLAELDGLIHLKKLPPPPWRARLSFGPGAMSRLP
jgi:hypothetical protein